MLNPAPGSDKGARQDEPVDPRQVLAEIETELAGGRAVTLVGATGGPRYGQLRAGLITSNVHADQALPLSLSSTNMVLLELVCQPPKQFWLKGEIQHREATSASIVGVYVCHQLAALPRQTAEHCFLTCSFADQGSGVAAYKDRQGNKANRVLVEHRRFTEPGLGVSSSNRIAQTPLLGFYPPPAGQAPWHSLAIRFAHEEMEVYWDNKSLGKTHLKEFARLGNLILPPTLPNPATDYQPQQSLGLFVQSGTASYRNVVVEPITEFANEMENVK